jgi:glycine hydroxymethyltransferase
MQERTIERKERMMTTAAIGASRLERYLQGLDGRGIDPSAAAVYASLDAITPTSPIVAEAVVHELRDQRRNLKLIASENYSSLAVQLAQGNLLTDKYAEGIPHHRFYAGCDNVDTVEAEAARLACEIFGAGHAYVQPHSGADANLVAFLAILSAKVETPILESIGQSDPSKLSREEWSRVREAFHGQKLLALDYYSGGHLTHGYRHNVSSQLFDAYTYSVDRETKLLDYAVIRKQALEIKPLVLLAGYSAYPRSIDFAAMREIADEVGAVFMVDMAHFAGLVAGKVFTGDFDPVAHAQIVTSTTHKTLRGPRGGIILCTDEFAEWVDKGCPMVLGGPLPHVIAAKAVALQEASRPAFRTYAQKIVENARVLAESCIEQGMQVLTGGTDNHLLLVDVSATYGLTGRQAETALRECGITLNRNALPFDENGPWYTSGLRVGTPAVTTLDMGTHEMREIGAIMHQVLSQVTPTTTGSGKTSKAKYRLETRAAEAARSRVHALLDRHPVYPQLDLAMLMSSIGEQP